jgi:hypothetical protein
MKNFEHLMFAVLIGGMFLGAVVVLAMCSKRDRGTWKFWK